MTNEIQPAEPTSPEPRHPIPPAPIHPLAALATIVLDNLFTLPEIAVATWVITIPVIGGMGFLTTLFVQRFLSKDGWGASFAKAFVMGIISGVPFSVTGSAAGGILLAWAGLHEWVKLSPPKRGPKPPSEEIVDVEAKDAK
jgi:hypothetical protein